MTITIEHMDSPDSILNATGMEILNNYLKVVMSEDLAFYYSHSEIKAFTVDEES